MTHNKMVGRDPSVIVTTNRNELKIYHPNIIYLNNGDNFELRFFNPLNFKIGVDIIFNGIKRNDSYLVLYPGQDITLDRFLDKKNKMIFDTYLIDGDNEHAKKAIENNGLIELLFYREQINYYYNEHDNTIYKNFPKRKKQTDYGTGGCGYSGTSDSSGLGGASGISGFRYSTVTDIKYNINNTASINNYNENFYSTTISNFSNPLETGRVEIGDNSIQEIKQVSVNFETTPFHNVTYKLLPYSTKNINVKEIRNYCSECGYRIRKDSWKYCPKCGSELH